MSISRAPLRLAIATVAVVAVACSDATEARTYTVAVRVQYPANYASSGAAGARVVLRNTQTTRADTVLADTAGIARFLRVVPGTYDVLASRALTAAEAQALTGIAAQTQLNAQRTAQSLLTEPTAPITLQLAGTRLGDLVIKEVYFTGSATPSGGTYFSDQFIELYNNSTDTLYLDSLFIGDAFGNSGQINPTSQPTPFNTDAGSVYLSNVWMIPGTGRQRPLAPGASILIAQDGINHRTDANGNANSPVDLSTAEWESFNERPDNRDLDAPGVPNLSRIYFTGGFDWLLTVFGPAVVIFRAPTFESLEQVPIPNSTLPPRIRVPNARIIDGFEALQNGTSGSYKRLTAAVDAGFVFASGTYTSQSARRRTAAVINGRRVLQDTNNSGNDFEVITPPTPRVFGAVAPRP